MARHISFREPASLYTQRLCLRAPTPHDAEALYDLFADEEVMHGLGRAPVSAVEDVRAMIDAMISGWRTEGLGPFIFETAPTDRQVVGQAGLMIFDARDWTASTWADAGSHAQPELGWALLRAHWGRGYATEGARGNTAVGVRASIHHTARFAHLAGQSPLSASRAEARRRPGRNRHPSGFGPGDGRLEASARRLRREQLQRAAPTVEPWSSGDRCSGQWRSRW